jgi:hypothetical protein
VWREITNLLVNDGSEPSLTLHNGIRHTKLAAQSGQEHNQLNRVNIVGNQDQGRLLVLNEADNVVETVLDSIGFLANILLLLAILDGCSLLD